MSGNHSSNTIALLCGGVIRKSSAHEPSLKSKLIARMDVIAKQWGTIAAPVRVLLVHMLSLVVFVWAFFVSFSIAIVLIRTVSGLLALLILPGAYLSFLTLPDKMQTIGTAFTLGLVSVVIEIEMLFVLSLCTGLRISLLTWLSFGTVVIMILSMLVIRRSSRQFSVTSILCVKNEIWLILFIALAVRIVLMCISSASIAPDACLYSDYARNLINGNFTSSILNDNHVFDLWNGIQCVSHQGITYVFAVWWLLCPLALSGPVPMLVLIGTLMICATYSIVESISGTRVATVASMILTLHPLFVFHSSVAYGPEITSLLLMLYGAFFFIKGQDGGSRTFLVSGLLIGVVDSVWYPNYYIVCLVLPIAYACVEARKKPRQVLFAIMMALVLLARLFIGILLIHAMCWSLIFMILIVIWNRKPEMGLQKQAPFFLGILVAMVMAPWTQLLQLVSEGGPTEYGGTLLSAVFASISFETALRFVFFIFFHVTPPLLFMIPLAILSNRNRRTNLFFVIAGMIGAVGTLKVFGLFTKETLLPIYLFSDSRFFLFITLMFIIPVGTLLEETSWDIARKPRWFPRRSSMTKSNRRSALIIGVILIGFAPSYLVMQSGFALTNIEERYAWSGLLGAVSGIGDDSTVFLVDRAREFAWLTGRRSTVLQLSNVYLPYTNASRELLSLAVNFSADYLIVDDYTVAHWGTLDFFLLETISLDTSVILGNLEIVEFYESSDTFTAPALTLIAQTEPNEVGTYCRVFSFDAAILIRFRNVSILDTGWSASNFGSITNVSGEVRLTIGNDQNSTNTWRPEGFDFDQMVNSGFLLLDLEAVSATVSRIEVWDENGIILRHAENLGNGLYYCPLEEVTIGDIRIVIEGSSGESIIVRSISVWQVENP